MVSNKIARSDLEFNRIESEFYQTKYLNAKSSGGNRSLLSFGVEVIHPAEVKREYAENGSLKIVLAQNVRDNLMDWSTEKCMDFSFFPFIARNKLYPDDVLVTRSGANYGQTSVITIETEMNNLFACADVLILKPGEIGGPLLSTYLNCNIGKLLMIRGVYGAGQPHIAPNYISKIPFPEYLIASRSNIDALIYTSRKKQKEANLLYSQATQLLEKELGLDLTITFENQNKYICALDDLISARRIDPEYFSPKVKEIVRRISNLNHTTTSQNFNLTNGYPWDSQKFLDNNSGEPVVRIRDIRPGYIDNEQLTSLVRSYASSVGFPKAQTGDIVIGMDGIKYFYSSLIETPCLVNQRVCHLRPKSYSAVSPEYLSFIINSQIGQAQLLRDMTIATTVGHITNFNIAKLVIPIISDDFHKTITEMIISSNSAKKESKRLLEQAKTEVETLIEQAVNRS